MITPSFQFDADGSSRRCRRGDVDQMRRDMAQYRAGSSTAIVLVAGLMPFTAAWNA